MKRAVFLALFWLPSPLLAAKGDVSAPSGKMTAPLAGRAEKATPDTGKRVLHLQLKK